MHSGRKWSSLTHPWLISDSTPKNIEKSTAWSLHNIPWMFIPQTVQHAGMDFIFCHVHEVARDLLNMCWPLSYILTSPFQITKPWSKRCTWITSCVSTVFLASQGMRDHPCKTQGVNFWFVHGSADNGDHSNAKRTKAAPVVQKHREVWMKCFRHSQWYIYNICLKSS